jgi:hypothetical protein
MKFKIIDGEIMIIKDNVDNIETLLLINYNIILNI